MSVTQTASEKTNPPTPPHQHQQLQQQQRPQGRAQIGMEKDRKAASPLARDTAHAPSPFAAWQQDLPGHSGAPLRGDATEPPTAQLTVATLAAAARDGLGDVAMPAPRVSHPNSAVNFTFAALCQLFEGLLGAVNKVQQYARLEAFWKGLPRDESFFPFMRLLMPHLDNVRPLYRLRESKLARLYVDAMGLHERSGEAQRLLQWKDPARSSVETTSFSDVVFVTLQRKGGFQRRNLCPPAGPPQPGTTLMAQAEESGVSATFRSFTVESINAFLDSLATTESSNGRQQLIMNSLLRTTPTEQKWIIRIILKDMKFRMTHQTLLAAFHPTALDKYNSTSDLAYVCEACLEEISKPAPGSRAAGVFLFLPLRPMLASPVTAKKLEELLSAEAISLEPKYDGERIMVHVDAHQVMYWTRNAKNYTSLYGPKLDTTVRSAFVVGSQVHIPHVKNLNTAQNVDEAVDGAVDGAAGATKTASPTGAEDHLVTLDNAIFDGELLVYDSSASSFIPFGLNRSFAAAREGYIAAAGGTADETSVDGRQRWFCYMVFDIVFLNGKSLMHLPLSARRGILRCLVREQKYKMEIVPSHNVKTTQDILAWLQKMVDASLEGVVLKAGDSAYVPAERKSKWVKLKTDHIAGLSDTVDLVVVGGYHGTKFGARHISHFLMAVWANDSSRGPCDAAAKFRTVCKIGNGFTSEELSTIQAALEPHWETTPSRHAVPPWLDGWKPANSDLIPDVYVHPWHSVVLEVYGYSFVPSGNHGVKFTIRFPRMLRVRFDKGLADATDLLTLSRIKDASKEALGRRTAADGGGGDELLTVMSMKWKRRRDERANAATRGADGGESIEVTNTASLDGGDAATRQAASSLPPRTIANVSRTLGITRLTEQDAVLDDLFAGYEFCVLFTSEATCGVEPVVAGNRVALERCLLQHGAQVVANPGRHTSLLLASSAAAPKVENWASLCRARPAYVQGKYAATDVVHCDWAMLCVQEGRVIPLAPRFLLYTSPSLASKFKLLLDAFEDSFYEPATVDSLAYALEQARRQRRRGCPAEPSSSTRSAEELLWNATNRVYDLKKELDILCASTAIRLAAVDIASTAAVSVNASQATRRNEEASAPLCAAEDSDVWVSDRLAARILAKVPNLSHTAVAAAPGAASVKPEPPQASSDALGGEPPARRQRRGALPEPPPPSASSAGCPEEEASPPPVALSSRTMVPFPKGVTVPQFLTIVRLVEERDCHVAMEGAEFALVTHVVDTDGTLRKVLPPP